MPTAGEFEAMAAALDTERTRLDAVGRVAPSLADPGIVEGLALQATVAASLDSVVGLAGAASSGCDGLAATCRERAEVCRQYTAGYRAYQRAMASYQWMVQHAEPDQYIGSPPYPPPRPAIWAEVG